MNAPGLIELRLNNVGQLFNTMDPSPFHEKDLDADAEAFIESWAAEIPSSETIGLRVHLEHTGEGDPALAIGDAVHHYFESRAEHAERDFRQLMRQGRLSLVIGVVFLAVCTTLARLAMRQDSVWASYAGESLTIAGWVAMWRPMQIYLYEWWPIRRRIRNLLRLSGMPVEVLAAGGDTPVPADAR